LLLFAVVSPLAAQEKPQPADGGKPVDQTKLRLGDLYRLGDPEINKMLPDLYWALKVTEGEPSAPAIGRTPAAKMPDVMSMLRDPSVRDEIEMLDEQYEDLQERRGKIVREMNQQIVGLLSAEVGDPFELREEIGKIRARAEEATQKAVLPFQFERLKQDQQTKLRKILGDESQYHETPSAKRNPTDVKGK